MKISLVRLSRQEQPRGADLALWR